MVGIVSVNVAVEVPAVVVSVAVELAVPSRFSVTLPVGLAVPAGGVPTVSVAVTVRDAPSAGVVVEGTMASDVELGWNAMGSGDDVLAA